MFCLLNCLSLKAQAGVQTLTCFSTLEAEILLMAKAKPKPSVSLTGFVRQSVNWPLGQKAFEKRVREVHVAMDGCKGILRNHEETTSAPT